MSVGEKRFFLFRGKLASVFLLLQQWTTHVAKTELSWQSVRPILNIAGLSLVVAKHVI